MAGINLRQLAKAINRTDTIITPKLTTWLIQHGDDAYPDWVVDRIATILKTPPRDRSGSFSGSGAGGCMRYQELAFLGMQGAPTDAQLQNIYNDGKWRHLRWQACLLTAGLLVDIEFPLPWPAMRSMGSMDGLGVVPDDHQRQAWRRKEFLLELKGISTFQFQGVRNNGPLPKHRKQIHRYFLSGGYELAVVIYEDKTTQNWHEVVVEPDDKLLEESKRELEALNAAVNKQRLHPMLDECKGFRGTTYSECGYGKSTGVCHKAGTWPRLKVR